MSTALQSSLRIVRPPAAADERIDALIGATVYRKSLKGLVLTYSFPDRDSDWSAIDYRQSREPFASVYRGLELIERANAASVVAEWARVADIRLTAVEERGLLVGDIRIACSDVNFAAQEGSAILAHAYLPEDSPRGSDIRLGLDALEDQLTPRALGGRPRSMRSFMRSLSSIPSRLRSLRMRGPRKRRSWRLTRTACSIA